MMKKLFFKHSLVAILAIVAVVGFAFIVSSPLDTHAQTSGTYIKIYRMINHSVVPSFFAAAISPGTSQSNNPATFSVNQGIYVIGVENQRYPAPVAVGVCYYQTGNTECEVAPSGFVLLDTCSDDPNNNLPFPWISPNVGDNPYIPGCIKRSISVLSGQTAKVVFLYSLDVGQIKASAVDETSLQPITGAKMKVDSDLPSTTNPYLYINTSTSLLYDSFSGLTGFIPIGFPYHWGEQVHKVYPSSVPSGYTLTAVGKCSYYIGESECTPSNYDSSPGVLSAIFNYSVTTIPNTIQKVVFKHRYSPIIAPSASISALPTSVFVGNKPRITWSCTNSTSAVGTTGNFSTGGSLSGTADGYEPADASAQIYTIRCTGSGGIDEKSVSVTGYDYRLSVSPTPQTITKGSSTTVTLTKTLTQTIVGGNDVVASITLIDGPGGVKAHGTASTLSTSDGFSVSLVKPILSASPDSSVVNITTQSNTPTGTYAVTISGLPETFLPVNSTVVFNINVTAQPVAQYPLNVDFQGNGAGSVTGLGTSCASPNLCIAQFNDNTVVNLTANATRGIFTGWSGECSGTGVCSVTMSAAKYVTATFNTLSSLSSPSCNLSVALTNRLHLPTGTLWANVIITNPSASPVVLDSSAYVLIRGLPVENYFNYYPINQSGLDSSVHHYPFWRLAPRTIPPFGSVTISDLINYYSRERSNFSPVDGVVNADSCAPVSPPTASLTINGTDNVTLYPEQYYQYDWLGTNAPYYGSTVETKATGSSTVCGVGKREWVAKNSNNSATGWVTSDFIGCEWEVVYMALDKPQSDPSAKVLALDKVNVKIAAPAPSVNIKAAPPGGVLSDGPVSVARGAYATIDWRSANTSYCEITWTGEKKKSFEGLNGTETSINTINSTITYTANCTGANGGTVSDSVRIEPTNVQYPLSVIINQSGSGVWGHWAFDETSGASALDSSGNDHSGTLVGAPSRITNGHYNNALKFNGSTQYVSSADTPSASAYSISFWARKDGNGSASPRGIMVSQGATYIDSCYNNQVLFSVSTGSGQTLVQGGVCPINNVWNFYTGTYDGGTAKLYVNGVLVATTGSVSGSVLPGAFNIGRYSGGGYYFNGAVDDVKIYQRALSALEVGQAYSGTAMANGAGNVTSNTGGINCPSSLCSTVYDSGVIIGLTATPSTGSVFGGWSGACLSSGNNLMCPILMNMAKTAIAKFEKAPPAAPYSCAITPGTANFTITKGGQNTVTNAVTFNQSGSVNNNAFFRGWIGDNVNDTYPISISGYPSVTNPAIIQFVFSNLNNLPLGTNVAHIDVLETSSATSRALCSTSFNINVVSPTLTALASRPSCREKGEGVVLVELTGVTGLADATKYKIRWKRITSSYLGDVEVTLGQIKTVDNRYVFEANGLTTNTNYIFEIYKVFYNDGVSWQDISPAINVSSWSSACDTPLTSISCGTGGTTCVAEYGGVSGIKPPSKYWDACTYSSLPTFDNWDLGSWVTQKPSETQVNDTSGYKDFFAPPNPLVGVFSATSLNKPDYLFSYVCERGENEGIGVPLTQHSKKGNPVYVTVCVKPPPIVIRGTSLGPTMNRIEWDKPVAHTSFGLKYTLYANSNTTQLDFPNSVTITNDLINCDSSVCYYNHRVAPNSLYSYQVVAKADYNYDVCSPDALAVRSNTVEIKPPMCTIDLFLDGVKPGVDVVYVKGDSDSLKTFTWATTNIGSGSQCVVDSGGAALNGFSGNVSCPSNFGTQVDFNNQAVGRHNTFLKYDAGGCYSNVVPIVIEAPGAFSLRADKEMDLVAVGSASGKTLTSSPTTINILPADLKKAVHLSVEPTMIDSSGNYVSTTWLGWTFVKETVPASENSATLKVTKPATNRPLPVGKYIVRIKGTAQGKTDAFTDVILNVREIKPTYKEY